MNRFGAGGIYTDFRILVPLFVMAMILVLGWHRRHPAHELANQVMAEEVARTVSGLEARSEPAPTPQPEPTEIPVVHMDGTPVRTERALPDPALLGAIGAGFLFAAVGVVGAVLLLRPPPRDEAAAAD